MKRSLTEILINILLQEPFFGHLAANLLREIREDLVETGLLINANGTITLGVNPDFWKQKDLSESHRYGAIKHELLHLALLHPFRQKAFDRSGLFAIAADLVVNQYLAKEHLREDQITLAQLESLHWEPHRSVEYYYQCLEELEAGAVNISGDDQQSLEQWMQEDHPAQAGHQFWQNALEDTSLEQKDALASSWEHRLKNLISREAAADFYRLEEALRELISTSLRGSRSDQNWKRILKMFATNSRKMLLKDTIRRPSKRYGTVPGLKIRRHQKLLIALDSSGSLAAEQLAAFFREIHQLWRMGAELTIVECDDQIRAQYPYRGQKIEEVSGRGATAFEAPIHLANESRADGLIYLTDGFGPSPQVAPRIPMLWMISPEGIRSDSRNWRSLPGRIAKMTS